MPRTSSPYIVGDYWLDKRRDGKSPEVWQIARAVKRSVLYRSTHCTGLEDAKGALDAHVAAQKALGRQEATEAQVLPLLMAYWTERGSKAINADQTGRSLRTFIAFLAQDRAGVRAVVTDLGPALFERFREWRMGPHRFSIPWAGETVEYASDKGVSGDTVQRNINDIRAAVIHAQSNMRIPMAPRIKDVEKRHRSAPRDRVLTLDELARIVWYAKHNADLFRFVTLQIATGVRPQAALAFNPATQYDDSTGRIDLHPDEAPQTKKRNAVLPAIRPLRVVLRAWARAGANPAGSRKTAWRIMRRTLGLGDDVFPKTIRHAIATMLYAMGAPEREIVEMMGHDSKLAPTTRIYAKYRPENLAGVTAALTTIWRDISREARRFAADHTLTTIGQGGKNAVVRKDGKV